MAAVESDFADTPTIGDLMKTKSKQFHFPREVLLIEIGRRCADPDCGRKNLIGLTKPEAIQYRGFDCSHCGRWNDDQLGASELPAAWFGDETELVI